jgi:hypothetical protein
VIGDIEEVVKQWFHSNVDFGDGRIGSVCLVSINNATAQEEFIRLFPTASIGELTSKGKAEKKQKVKKSSEEEEEKKPLEEAKVFVPNKEAGTKEENKKKVLKQLERRKKAAARLGNPEPQLTSDHCPECYTEGYLILPGNCIDCQTCLKMRFDFIDLLKV